jgi:hypothetical protein
MAIAAKISPAELTAQVTDRFVGKYYEARLINAPGTSYIPGTTNDATFLSNEVVAGTGGYVRQTFWYDGGDVSAYSDDGVALATKATIFAHDGSGTAMTFSHAALVESNGSVLTLGAVSGAPSAGVNGTYLDLPVTAGAAGLGLTVDLTITNAGAAPSDYALTIKTPGYGFVGAEALTISEAVLVAAGAVSASAGGLGFTAATVYSSTNDLVAVAQTASTVSLTGGNETVFYWNLKQFGYYSV